MVAAATMPLPQYVSKSMAAGAASPRSQFANAAKFAAPATAPVTSFVINKAKVPAPASNARPGGAVNGVSSGVSGAEAERPNPS
jgi:hypothetical protein